MIKAIAIDIDGTFINSNEKIPFENIEAIKAAEELGIKIIFASGRTLTSVKNFIRQFTTKEYPIIAYNGAMIEYNGNLMENAVLPGKIASSVIRLCQKEGYYIQAYVNDVLTVAKEEKETLDYAEHADIDFDVNPELVTFIEENPPTKLLIIDTPATTDFLLERLDKEFTEARFVKSFPIYLEVMPNGIDKGIALGKLTESMGIGLEDLAAFGDNDNDIGMIKMAGTGIAMQNGTPGARGAADIIAPSNNDGGFAKALLEIL